MRLSGRFIEGATGPLAMVIREPLPALPRRFCVLFVPPFGDEMNKSRRTVSLLASELASAGGVVATLDPRGTGDSAGEHGDATWEGWREDVETAWAWLQGAERLPGVLWGLRLGALLATQLVADNRIAPAFLLLWQPVLSGRSYVNQFLRLAGAQQLSEGADAPNAVKQLRAALAEGQSIEVGGYDLHPTLVNAVEGSTLESMAPGCEVVWRDSASSQDVQALPATTKAVERWRSQGIDVDLATVVGPSFWASQEIAEGLPLVSSSREAFAVRGLLHDHHRSE